MWLCYVKLFQYLIEQLLSSSSRQSPTEKEKMDTVLVAGATGGVGKWVVDVLRKKGIHVCDLVWYSALPKIFGWYLQKSW